MGDSYLNGGLLVEEEGTGPLDNSGDKESIGSTAAATTRHDGGDPDLIAIVDELFHDVVIDEMTTKTFYCLVGDCVGQDKMNKNVKGAIKERLTYYGGGKKEGIKSCHRHQGRGQGREGEEEHKRFQTYRKDGCISGEPSSSQQNQCQCHLHNRY